MTPRFRSVLAALLRRVAERGQLDAVFLAEETRRWPEGAFEALTKSGLMREIAAADSVSCSGCEERCRRPIVLSENDNGREQRAIWTCNLFEDFGPFDEPVEVLRRWSSSRSLVAKFVSRSLRLEIIDHDANWRRIKYATVKMNGRSRAFSTEFDGNALARVGSASIPLIELLDWDDAIGINRSALGACVDESEDTQSGGKRVQASTTLREDAKLNTQLRERRLQQRIESLARKHPRFNKEQLAKKLVQANHGEGMSVARIVRVTRMPKKSGRKNSA